MNLLVAINQNYINQLNILLKSIQISNPKAKISVYVLHKDLQDKDIEFISCGIFHKQLKLHFIQISNRELEKFPVYEKRYPVEIYFRIFATKYLPDHIDRVLYLDTDIVVINELKELYQMDFEGNYFIAATHIQKILHKFHEVRLGLHGDYPYINTGVLLMNLKELRKVLVERDVITFVEKNHRRLMLPDQDIISALYGDKIKLVDELRYNLGERAWRLYNLNHPKTPITWDWIERNTVIIHYYGRNKPWNGHYRGRLNYFYYKMGQNGERDIDRKVILEM